MSGDLCSRRGSLGSLLLIHVNTNVCAHAKSLQLCPTLCSPLDYSLSGSSVHGTFQARILERVAIPFSKGSS